MNRFFRTAGSAAGGLLMAAAGAQPAATPLMQPGQWELVSRYQGGPSGSDTPRSRTACLSAAAIGALPEKALLDAAAPPVEDRSRPAPVCELSALQRDGAGAIWTKRCEGQKVAGSGRSTWASPQQVQLSEKLTIQIGFLNGTLVHELSARRIGDCTS